MLLDAALLRVVTVGEATTAATEGLFLTGDGGTGLPVDRVEGAEGTGALTCSVGATVFVGVRLYNTKQGYVSTTS